ncbi:MAG: hypothetical protein ACE5D0_07635 [Fidelibacterota bacterium]
MKRVVFTLIIMSALQGDPTAIKVSGSYFGRSGNLDYHYFNGSFSVTKNGLIRLGKFSFPDTELLFSASRAKSTYNKSPYEDDGNSTLKLDLYANQTFSPFIFAGWGFDSLSALDSRSNVGIGGKYRFGPYFSISYAALFEEEKYINEDPVRLTRHSLRPKYKRSFDSPAVTINWQVYYKPRFDNMDKYLLKSILVLSFKTFKNALTLDINYYYDFDSKYQLDKIAKSYAYAVDENGGYLTLAEYEDLNGTIDSNYTTDDDDYVLLPNVFYKPEDHTVSVGLTYSF